MRPELRPDGSSTLKRASQDVQVASTIKESDDCTSDEEEGDTVESVSKSGISIPSLDGAGFGVETPDISADESLVEALSIAFVSTSGTSSSEKRSSNTGELRLFDSIDFVDE